MAAARGKHKDALRHYEKAAKVAPDRAQPHVSIGSVLLRMGKTNDAVAACQRAVELAPEDGQALTALADALRATGRRDQAEQLETRVHRLTEEAALRAIAPSERLADLPPGERLHLSGYHARQQGRTEAAIAAWLEEARAYGKEGRLDAALDACHQALTVSSGSTLIHLELVRLYLMRGWDRLAIERILLLHRLLELAPDPTIAAELADLARRNVARDGRLAAVAAPPAG